MFGKEGEKLKEVKLSVSVHKCSGCSVLCSLFVMLCAPIILRPGTYTEISVYLIVSVQQISENGRRADGKYVK